MNQQVGERVLRGYTVQPTATKLSFRGDCAKRLPTRKHRQFLPGLCPSCGFTAFDKEQVTTVDAENGHQVDKHGGMDVGHATSNTSMEEVKIGLEKQVGRKINNFFAKPLKK